MRVKAFRRAERQGGAAEHALERTHEIVVAEQPEIAAFAEPDSELGTVHRGDCPLSAVRCQLSVVWANDREKTPHEVSHVKQRTTDNGQRTTDGFLSIDDVRHESSGLIS